MEYITICNLVMGCEAVERAAGICEERAEGGGWEVRMYSGCVPGHVQI